MLRKIAVASVLLTCLCSYSNAGDVIIMTIVKTNLPLNLIKVEVSGTLSLATGEVYDGWTPSFLLPDGTTVRAATIDTFTAPTGGGPAQPCKFSTTITNAGANQGDWTARSQLGWTNPTGFKLARKAFAIP